MKVLFVNHAATLPPSMMSDYQADMVFHGMRQLLGNNCQETYRMNHMYAKEKEENPEIFKEIWGKGFTMYGNLPETAPVNEGWGYDILIYPLHHTIAQKTDKVIEHFSSLKDRGISISKACIIDGWDRTDINDGLLQLCRDNGMKYFKRECTFTDETVKPISFAFPEEKIVNDHSIEHRNDIAPLIPVNQSIDPSYMSTYIYDDEDSYYKMYNNSYFALTSKKGGWDTLRHYEIMANSVLPIFVDIENCPEHTLWNFPKHLCKEVNFLAGLRLNLTNGQKWVPGMVLPHCGVINKDNPGDWIGHWGEYYDLLHRFTDYFNKNLLTKHLATYVLETMDENH